MKLGIASCPLYGRFLCMTDGTHHEQLLACMRDCRTYLVRYSITCTCTSSEPYQKSTSTNLLVIMRKQITDRVHRGIQQTWCCLQKGAFEAAPSSPPCRVHCSSYTGLEATLQISHSAPHSFVLTQDLMDEADSLESCLDAPANRFAAS